MVGNLLRSLLSKNVEARPAISRQKSTQVSCSFGDPITILEEQIHATIVPKLGIQIRKSKIYLNEVALRIGCRNTP